MIEHHKSGSWFITTPYVDAYETPWVVNWRAVDEPEEITFAEFEERMRGQAARWGGESMLRVAQSGLRAALHDEQPVLAMGIYGVQRYVYTTAGLDVVSEYPSWCDVT